MQYLRIDIFWYIGLPAKSILEKLGRAAYGKRNDQTTSQKDLLNFLVNAKDPGAGLPLPENEVLAEAVSFIVSSKDTTTSTTTSVMDFVSGDPDLQQGLYQEL